MTGDTFLSAMLYASDAARRLAGAAFDHLQLGPVETKYDIILSAPGFDIRRYGGVRSGRAPVLLVPAPIKRPYIFDLLPLVSVVQRLLRAEFPVYMIAWRDARADADWGLAEYASEWIGAAVESVSEQQRNKPILAGHSIGGTFVALFAAAQPDRVAKLLLIEAPLYFGEEAGALAPIVAGSPPGDVIAQFAGGGPGSLLDVASVAADPGEFVIGRWQDAVACALDPEGWAIHQRVIRWTLDEFAQPSRLFAETVELLYRRNAFARGELRLSGRAVLPQNLSQLAVASVIDVSSRLVPPVSALAPIEQAAVYEYEPERGVALQHVGPLVGRRAHGVLWPRLLEWLVAAVQPGYLE